MNSKKPLLTLLLIVFLDLVGVGVLIPVLPQLFGNPASPYFLLNSAADISKGYFLLGLLAAIYPLMMFFAAPVLGQLSDKYGRKRILIISLLGTCLGYLVFAAGVLLKNIPLLFISRALDGITGGNISVAQAAIADMTPPKDRAKTFGLIGAAFGLGFILGPFLGGKLSDPAVLSSFTAATPFWFTAILSFSNVLLIWLYFEETLAKKNVDLKVSFSRSLWNIADALKMKEIRGLFLISFLFAGGFSFFTTFFGVYLIEKFNFSQGNIGDYFAYVGIWIAFTQGVITRLVSRVLPEKKVLNFAIILTGVFLLCFMIPQAAWGLFLVTPLFAICNGLSMANLLGLISRSASPEHQGKVMGINSGVQALAQAIPAILAGVVAANFHAVTAVTVSGAVIVLAGVTFWLIKKPVQIHH